jgi:uncharacterized damage-inducible protein DinB
MDAEERTTVLALLQYQRESFVRKLEGVGDVDGAAAAVASGTSLLWLANHMADAERTWLLHRFEGADPANDPPHELKVEAALDRYRATWTAVDEVIASAPDLDRPCQPFDDEPPVSLRWILLHLLEETARHAGHADILRELVDGKTGR